jgi:hypothetical protein
MRPLAVLFSASVVTILFFMVLQAGHIDPAAQAPSKLAADQRIDHSVARVNQWFRQHWQDEGLQPAEQANDLLIFRRLSLALHGTIPSLEEIRTFDADSSTDRVERWLLKLLEDDRFADYFSERLARMLTGAEEGPFVIYRRDRLRDWLAEQIRQDRPWSQVTTDLIASRGLWTDNPASNFITVANIPDMGLDENKLAGKTVRAFLGQRIDCAQCHNHPFDSWKQQDFEGLAAFYGQARVTPGGVVDRTTEEEQAVEYEVVDPGEEEGRIVAPRVPFHDEWLPAEGTRRDRLAAWVVHPENRRFERAVANRMWGLMFGRSWFDPVDDLPHPSEDLTEPDLLDILGQEFRANNESLKYLIRLIAETDVFRMQSQAPGSDSDQFSHMSKEWAVFPVIRLRPEQVIGSMFQAGNIRTIDQNSNVFIRFIRFTNENDFLKEYGDAGEDELLQQTGTIPQALLRMNGKFTRELTKTDGFSAAAQLIRFSSDNETLLQNCFLACLSRNPTDEERQYFMAQLPVPVDQKQQTDPQTDQPLSDAEQEEAQDQETPSISRQEAVRDLYWILFNSPEFSWNH